MEILNFSMSVERKTDTKKNLISQVSGVRYHVSYVTCQMSHVSPSMHIKILLMILT